MLTKEEIKNIAELARIGVEEKEIEKYQHDLSAVLDYFKELSALNTQGLAPIGHITGMEDVLREDVQRDFGEQRRAAILVNAPELKDAQFKVKSVL